MGSIILMLNHSFVSLWAGEELFIGSLENLLIVILMVQLLLIRNEAFLIDVSLDIKKKVLLGVSSILLSSLFAILGYYYIDNSIVVIFIGIFLGRLHVLSIFPIIVNSIMKNRIVQLTIFLMIPIVIVEGWFVLRGFAPCRVALPFVALRRVGFRFCFSF